MIDDLASTEHGLNETYMAAYCDANTIAFSCGDVGEYDPLTGGCPRDMNSSRNCYIGTSWGIPQYRKPKCPACINGYADNIDMLCTGNSYVKTCTIATAPANGLYRVGDNACFTDSTPTCTAS